MSMESENGVRKQQPATITVYPQQQQVITTVTVPSTEQPPIAEPGVTYVQLKPGYFTKWPGILKLIELVSRFYLLFFTLMRSNEIERNRL